MKGRDGSVFCRLQIPGVASHRKTTYVCIGMTSEHNAQRPVCNLGFSLPLGSCHLLPGVFQVLSVPGASNFLE